MLVRAATAWRIAREPEWKSVPSPRFWKMCGISVNGAMPTHWAPSPPMWVMPRVLRFIASTMPWQPMPAARLQPGRDDLGDPVGVELAVDGDEDAALGVALADDARPLGLVVQDVADEELHQPTLLLDHEQLFEPAGELPDDAGLHREQHPDLEQADAVPLERGIVQAEIAQPLAEVVVGLRARAPPGRAGCPSGPVQSSTAKLVHAGGRLEPPV